MTPRPEPRQVLHRSDPTKTQTLRRAFRSAGQLRLNQLRRQIRIAVVDHDALGLAGQSMLPPAPTLKHFGVWLDSAAEQLLGDGWSDEWVAKAMAVGTRKAVREVGGMPDALDVSRLNHLVELSRAEIAGTCAALVQKLVRLASGAMMARRKPALAFRVLVAPLEDDFKHRIRAFANVMVVRAYNGAKLDVYRASGVSDVGVSPELKHSGRSRVQDAAGDDEDDFVGVLTAGDDLVCQTCEDIADDAPYSADEAEDLIPAHPNCRCSFYPWFDRRFAGDAFDPEQPRDPDGRWTSGGGGGGGESAGEGTGGSPIKKYLELVAKVSDKSREAFVLKHGKQYDAGGAILRGGDPKGQCYQNAGRIARDRPGRTYVEGYITVHGVPLQHAWTVDKNDRVHDTTISWKDRKFIGGYFGIPFKTSYLVQRTLETGKWGLLSHTNHKIFTEDPGAFLAGVPKAGVSPAQDLMAKNYATPATIGDVYKQLTGEQVSAMAKADVEVANRPATSAPVDKGGFVRPDGTYTPERQELHEQILSDMFYDEAIKAATPAPGEKPVLTLTGGRSASGKTSSLATTIGDRIKKSMYISADVIQESLPGYSGELAPLYNQEAQDIAVQAEAIALHAGINVLYDATMKSSIPANARVDLFKAAGYDVDGFFVHTTPLASAVRTVNRFTNTGRYTPPAVPLNSLTNEKTFDSMIHKFRNWAVFDNNGGKPVKVAGNV